MKVVMLAAGIGNRLKTVHNLPKCLLEINGETLLSRHISAIEKHQISELLLITGYEQKLIEDELVKISSSLNINTIFNKDYRKGSVLSFLTACNHMSIDSPVILMDADVFYDPELVDILFSTKHNNIFLLDRNFEPGDEPVKLCVAQDKIIEFRKQLSTTIKYEVIGESVGFFRFSKEVFRILHIQAEKYLKASAVNEPYEEVIRDVLLENPGLFSYADITGIPWIEIDFPDDIEKAKLLLG